MLGFDALGRLALGQIASATNTAMPAAVGSFALTGIASSFKVALPAAAAGYVFTGNGAPLDRSFPAGTGIYLLTGSDTAIVVDLDRASIGTGMSGGTFSRGRWRKLKQDDADRIEAERQAHEREEARQRQAARQAAADVKAAIEAARAAEDQGNATQARLRALIDARNAAAGAQQASDAIRNAARLANLSIAARDTRAEQDEEEAIVQLLLAA
jgi:hypothetical protein